MRHIEAQQIENLFAGNIRNLLMDAKLDYDKLYEIRLRVGRPLFLTYDGGECFLRKPGQEQYLVTTEDLKETLEYVTGYSLYAYEDEIRQGYISVQGGHRVGVTGKVVLDRGRIMEKNIWIFPHPSISADSSISLGISFIKLVRINTEIGTANAMYGPISDQIVS